MFWDDKIVSMEAQIAAQKRQIEAANAHRDAALTEHAAMKTELVSVRDALTEANVLREHATFADSIEGLATHGKYWRGLYDRECEERQREVDRKIAVLVDFITAGQVAHKLHELLEAGAGRDSREYIEGAALVLATECLQPVKAHDADSGGDA